MSETTIHRIYRATASGLQRTAHKFDTVEEADEYCAWRGDAFTHQAETVPARMSFGEAMALGRERFPFSSKMAAAWANDLLTIGEGMTPEAFDARFYPDH